MKRIIILFTFLSMSMLCRAQAIFQDDFESYATNTFPSSNGWILLHNGAGDAYQVVTENFHYSGSKSMQLKGSQSGPWAAHMYKQIPFSSSIIYAEAQIMASASNTGDAEDMGRFLFYSSSSPGVFLYSTTGEIKCNIGDTEQVIGSFNANEWYKLKMKLDVINHTIDVWVNDTLKVQNLNGGVFSESYNEFMLGAEHGNTTFFFDDVKVWNDSGLIAYYPFNGNANDESGNGNNGTVNGATLTTDRYGNVGQAYSFDGNSNYIEVPDNPLLRFDSSFSISLWVSLTSPYRLNYNMTLIGKSLGIEYSDSYTIYTGYWGAPVGTDAAYCNNSTCMGNDNVFTLELNTWYNITWVFDKVLNEESFYINNKLLKKQTITLTIEYDDHPLIIGRGLLYGTAAEFLDGKLDDILIYNRALTGDEIVSLYGNYEHQITSVKDIPNDEGGKVRIKWNKIYLDSSGTTPQITSYGVWRKIPAGLTVSKHPPSTMAILNDTLGVLYDYLGTVMATQSPSYNFVAQTLYDSSASGSHDEQYLITAHTADPNVYYISDIASGHSVNNSLQTSVLAKWNMVSVPLSVSDYSKSAIFPTSISDAFSFDGGYVTTGTLTNGNGYWLKFPASSKLILIGSYRDTDTITVHEGWSMIGSISQPLATNSITSDPPGIVTSNFYGFNQGYIPTDSIYPGKGYWVKVNQSGKLILSSSATMSAVNTIRIVPTTELPPSPPEGEIYSNNPIIPSEFALSQNFPNPFNPSTVIRYQLPVSSFVTLKLYNMIGKEISTLVNGTQDAGFKSVTWDASALPSGVYIYRLQTEKFSDTKKLLLVK